MSHYYVDFVVVMWYNYLIDKSEIDKETVMKLTGPYPTMYNRDEIFFRLGIEKSEELLQKIRCAENPNFQDTLGFSYLHRACQAHYLAAIEVLLKMGANPNIDDKRGHSPILQALGSINENNNAILELMLEYGLDLDKMEGEMTLKEHIESFKKDEWNRIIDRYYNSST